jgi:hypothetical protein
VGRLFDPSYLVVVNPPHQFSGDRFQYVEQSRARALFSHIDLAVTHPCKVRFKLGVRRGTDLTDCDSLPFTSNSPYIALCLAAHMGARRIGLLGVDFTDHHFFAQTGAHPLASRFESINKEYQNLFQALSQRGIEVFNLSRQSRLTGIPKIAPETFFANQANSVKPSNPSVFFVGYKFLSCGRVFDDGLARAADELGLRWDAAQWDDPALSNKVSAFHPDLLFVIHGRKFTAKWRSLASRYPSAVWLLDEPYEVDNTERYSGAFDTVFVNDPSTLHRHRNAHYLPTCFDPSAHRWDESEPRTYSVGFIGGANEWRERALSELEAAGLLSYIVGGPWQNPKLNKICLSGNIPAEETAQLYRKTKIVINLFRDKHHFNLAKVPAVSMNPRIYEALACGALVISEHRPEVESVFPELPSFKRQEDLKPLVRKYLDDPALLHQTLEACYRRLTGHSYADRLRDVISKSTMQKQESIPGPSAPLRVTQPMPTNIERVRVKSDHKLMEGWEQDRVNVDTGPEDDLILSTPRLRSGTSETGIVTSTQFRNVRLDFEVLVTHETNFIAKIHSQAKLNQYSNSYHISLSGSRGYLARHNHLLKHFQLPLDNWVRVSFSYSFGTIDVCIDGLSIGIVKDDLLPAGYCFLGTKQGVAKIRRISLNQLDTAMLKDHADHDLIVTRKGGSPKVSIITTVYDRVDCLDNCIRSVQRLRFQDVEQIIVADAPGDKVIDEIHRLVRNADPHQSKISLANLHSRRNDWGISPASAGLSMATGSYVCFLSDDNGYAPTHFDPLVDFLDRNPSFGFAYSSCLYAGRRVLDSPFPRACQIDLGQPLFRSELFNPFKGSKLPFNEFAWDWRMINYFMRKKVRWKHVDEKSFIFRLAEYPHLMADPVGA